MLTNIMGPNGKYIALLLFALASFTDFLDGYIARKNNLVTNFGKFMDPLADKLLVGAAMISFVELGKLPAGIVITIISREFIISGFRLVASDNGVVIAASYWGKFKTVSQMIMIILLILDFQNSAFILLENIFIYVALILTIVSLIDYLIKNKGVLGEGSNK
jgi:CDP-diacylglycerol--glycerol-3-phosphate 3-phosphatidyltransferase